MTLNWKHSPLAVAFPPFAQDGGLFVSLLCLHRNVKEVTLNDKVYLIPKEMISATSQILQNVTLKEKL